MRSIHTAFFYNIIQLLLCLLVQMMPLSSAATSIRRSLQQEITLQGANVAP